MALLVDDSGVFDFIDDNGVQCFVDDLGNVTCTGGNAMTAALPALTDTWNNGATTFEAVSMDVTDTASAAASLLLNLKVAGTTKYQVDKNGKWGDGVNFKTGWDGAFGAVCLRDAADSVFAPFYASAVVARVATGAQFVIGTSESTFTDSAANQVLVISSPGFRFGGLAVNSAGHLQFSSTLNATGTPDAGFSRNSAGVVEVNNGTTGTFRDVLTRGLRSTAVAFASAIASPIEGTLQAFTDSSTATWGATITGGGANHVLGYYNGTNWTVAAK